MPHEHYAHPRCESDARPLENSSQIKKSWRSNSGVCRRFQCRRTKYEDQEKKSRCGSFRENNRERRVEAFLSVLSDPLASLAFKGFFPPPKSNAVQASHPDRIVRGFLPAFSPQGGGTIASARQRSKGVPHLPKPVAGSGSPDQRSFNHAPATPLRLASGPNPLQGEGWGGGRNARATSSRSRAVPECPPMIHPRESPAAASSAAIIQQAQERSRFR